MRRAAPLLAAALLASALLAACGSAGEEATDALAAEPAAVATEAQASVGDAVDAALEEAAVEAEARAEEAQAATTAPAVDNAGAWAAVDGHARTFAGRLDEATQAIASCQTEAAEGADFDACTAASYEAVAAAGDALVAGMDEGLATADGTCRAALEAMREAAAVMADDYRAAIGVTDLTGLETAYERIAADAEVYAMSVVDAAGACAGG